MDVKKKNLSNMISWVLEDKFSSKVVNWNTTSYNGNWFYFVIDTIVFHFENDENENDRNEIIK